MAPACGATIRNADRQDAFGGDEGVPEASCVVSSSKAKKSGNRYVIRGSNFVHPIVIKLCLDRLFC